MRPALVAALALAVVATAGPGCGRRGANFAILTDSLIARPDGGELRLVRLRDRHAVVHEAWLRLPAPPDSAAAPALVPVVILGGIGTGREAATLVPCPAGYALLALDYPYAGPRAPSRSELVAALPRARAEDGRNLGPAGVRERPAWEREAAAWGLALFFSELEPARWIGRVAPRPVLFLGGTRDEFVGEASARLLHARAREPKTVVWLDTEHMRPEADSLLIGLVKRARGWFEEVEADSTDRGPRSPTRRGAPRGACAAAGAGPRRWARRCRRGGSDRSDRSPRSRGARRRRSPAGRSR
jgi:hypothetical protein